MKTKTLFALAAVAVGSGIAFAQEGGNRLADMIKRADSNNDGKISKEEFANARKAEVDEQFSRIDTNGDGFADESEMQAIAGRMRDGGPRREGGEGMRRPEGGAEGGGFRRPPGEGRPEGGAPPPSAEAERRPEGGPGGPGGPGMMGRGAGGGSPMGGLFQMMTPDGFAQVDKNGDGGIDVSEFKENAAKSAEQGFARMDQNGDGKISQDEIRKAGEGLRAMMGGRGGEGRPGGPGGGGGEGGGFRRPPSEEAPKPEGQGKKDGEV
jgi:Ca2+-binding EF-hand superfamily protein